MNPAKVTKTPSKSNRTVKQRIADLGKEPAMPTRAEKALYRKNRLFLPGWHFEKLFLPHCARIDDMCIQEERPDNKLFGSSSAVLYGLEAMNPTTLLHTTAALFVRFGSWVYQVEGILEFNELVNAIRKVTMRENYDHAVWCIKNGYDAASDNVNQQADEKTETNQ